MPAIIEQKVTGQEALGGFRQLVHRFGERAPGAGHGPRRSGCSPRRRPSGWCRRGSGCGCTSTRPAPAPWSGRRRSRPRSSAPPGCRPRRPTGGSGRCPGIGVWTSAEVRFRAHGDADAVSFGDYHIAKNVGLGADRAGGRRRRPGRAAGALPAAPLPGPAARRARRVSAGRGTARGWRRAGTCPRPAASPRGRIRTSTRSRLPFATTRSTSMKTRYSRPYFARNTAGRSGSPSVATASTGRASGSTLPLRLHGTSSTREVCRSRLTLPLPAGVVTSRSAPSRATHTGVETGTPVLRYVVSETKRSSPRCVEGAQRSVRCGSWVRPTSAHPTARRAARARPSRRAAARTR